MSEKYVQHDKRHEHHQSAEIYHNTIEQVHSSIEKTHDAKPSAEQAHKNAAEHAKPSSEYATHHTASQHHERPHHYITSTVKKGVYLHTMDNVQRHLSPTERRFSKIIHSDTIESLSELGASTVGRSSAILGGGVVMVLGGAILLYMARYFGFSIPLSSLFILYGLGFLIIIVVDIIIKPLKLAKRKRQR